MSSASAAAGTAERSADDRLEQNYSAAAWRKATPAPDPSSVIDLELPSGFVVQVTRPPLDLWIMSGAVPLDLMDQAIEVHAAKSPEEKKAKQQVVEEELQSDPDKLRRAITFMGDAVRHALVRPRVVAGTALNNPNDIDLKDIPPDDFSFIFQWVMFGSPGVPVKTENGKGTTVETVSTFRQESGVRSRRSGVRKTAGKNKRKARHKG